jgi:membrane-bound lytic murein transglycosylase B
MMRQSEATMRGISWTISAVALVVAAGAANAAQCGNTSAGFAQWKQDFTNEIKGRYGAAAISALASTNYNTATISADRNQSGFKLSFEQFMAKRGGAGIAARGKGMKGQAMFASIQSTYGVPPGPLLAIWGMETGFGAVRGNQNALSAVATLAYDCRRSAYFTDQLNAALTLVDRGVFSASTRGSMHGEVGHTQFLA